MIPMTALRIVRAGDENCWNWMHLPESRFSEGVSLVEVCWLEICGKISFKMLSPQTSYVVYLIFKLADTARGLDTPLQETTITVGDEAVCKKLVCIQPNDRVRRRRMRGQFRLWGGWGAGFGMDNALGMDNADEADKSAILPHKWGGEGAGSDDEWLEIEMEGFSLTLMERMVMLR